MNIRLLDWVEFHYVDEELDITVEGAPGLVIEIADNLPDELVDTAVVYYDEGEGHIHVLLEAMRRDPDGGWQWQS